GPRLLARGQDAILHEEDGHVIAALLECGCRIRDKICVARFEWITRLDEQIVSHCSLLTRGSSQSIPACRVNVSELRMRPLRRCVDSRCSGTSCLRDRGVSLRAWAWGCVPRVARRL